ncbi:MAG TPA: hypothetical protein DCL72_00905 [Rhizobiales bacterium]|nr:hypothetical protein [Hyphomicrobiales bacterium]HAN62652.1 hypothetical protein [Hyphomicrobiales bacterium]HBH42409.1 hypothetical protein [Hyphomicrobiales bacterium]HBR25893.1 hypothetical protein [Hyphomicrobiales bacterium]HCL63055.1 hypothetical protein [Hyphomicrobiales bacterium]
MIGQVLARVLLEAPLTLECNELADNRHQLYGNAMRFKPLADLKEDVAWKTAMPKGHRQLVAGLSWPLCLRYAYSSGRRGDAPAARAEDSGKPQ